MLHDCVVYFVLLQYGSFQVISQVAAFCSKLCHMQDVVILFIVLMEKWVRKSYTKERKGQCEGWRYKNNDFTGFSANCKLIFKALWQTYV